MSTRRRTAGFTLVEVVVTLAIAGALALLAVPAMKSWAINQRLVASTREVDAALSFARSEAIRRGNIFLVFVQLDTDGNPLVGPNGEAVQMLVVDDGRPGSTDQNCEIDAGEAALGVTLESDVSWGVSQATGPVSTDPGAASISGPSTFEDAGGNPARWVLFRPEGPPRAFSSDCTIGNVGSGGGGIYLNNGKRDKAVVMTPLGATRVHSWHSSAGAWTS